MGNAFPQAFVVHLHHDEVVFVSQLAGHFEREWREAADMLTKRHTIESDDGVVVCRAEVKENPRAGFGLIVEGPLVPDGPLVEEKIGPLRVPVAGDVEQRRLVEIVFNQIALVLRMSVLVEIGAARMLVKIVRTNLVWIDNGSPPAVQADGVPRANIGQRAEMRSLRECCQRDQRRGDEESHQIII